MINQQNTTNYTSSLPGTFVLLANAIQIFKNRWKTLCGILLISCLISLLFGAVFAGGIFLISSLLKDMALAYLSIFSILGLLLILVVIYILTWSQVALITAIQDSSIGVKESFSRAKSKIISFMWLGFIIGLIVSGGFLLLLIPGIIFSVWFSLAVFILVAENIKGLSAVLKSKEYVKGYFWPVFGRSLMFMLLYIILFIGLSIVSLILIFIPFLGVILNFLLYLIVPFIITPISILYIYLIYSSLKNIKGEISNVPQKGRVAFIIIGILGILIIPIIISPFFLIRLNSSATTEADDASIKSDLSQARTMAELIYDENNSYSSLCSDNTFNRNIQEIKKDNGGQDPICYALQDKYCISSILKSGESYCVDSTGTGMIGQCTSDASCIGRRIYR